MSRNGHEESFKFQRIPRDPGQDLHMEENRAGVLFRKLASPSERWLSETPLYHARHGLANFLNKTAEYGILTSDGQSPFSTREILRKTKKRKPSKI